MPDPVDGLLTRRRLLELVGALKPITLVSAPAGYGKTTLLRQWAAGADSTLLLDPAEIQDSWELWHQVENALRSTAVTVIIDDVHLLDGTHDADQLQQAFRLAGTDCRLVVATRKDPILALVESRLAGKVLEIRSDLLAFDEAETRAFLAINQIPVTSEQANAIWLRTEGWPAGLRLSTTPLSHAAQSEEAFATLLHGDTAVGSYLMGQALTHTSGVLRQFLLRTSVTEFLDADLAMELSGRTDSALLLEQARSQPGFLHWLPSGRWSYRYHPMFRALLRAELLRAAPDEARRLSATAAAWFLDHGDYLRAAPLAVEGKAWTVLAGAILAGSWVALATGDWVWVRAELARLPVLEQKTGLSARLARAMMELGLSARDEAMAQVSALLETATSSPSTSETEVLGYLDAWLRAERGDTTEAIQILDGVDASTSARELTSASRAARVMWRQLRAVCALVEGSSLALESLLDAPGPPETTTYPRAQLGECEIRTWTAIVTGNLHAARAELERAATFIAGASTRAPLPWSSTLRAAERWIELETGIEPPARNVDGREGGGASVFPSPVRRALETISAARARLLRDIDPSGSATMLDDLQGEQPQVRRWWSTAQLWTMTRIEAHLAEGELSNALELTLSQTRTNGSAAPTSNASYLWAWVMQRAALGRESGEISNDLDGVIEGLSIESPLLPGRSEALRIRVLLTAASLAFRFGSADRASHYLRAAVQSTDLHHWRRPYEEIAEAIAPVLEAERRRISTQGEQVIALLEELRFPPAHSARLPDPLSARELEILQYLPTPLDQRELCSMLFISRNTLKTHLRATYRKLGVQTRREAVLRAERLGIL